MMCHCCGKKVEEEGICLDCQETMNFDKALAEEVLFEPCYSEYLEAQ